MLGELLGESVAVGLRSVRNRRCRPAVGPTAPAAASPAFVPIVVVAAPPVSARATATVLAARNAVASTMATLAPTDAAVAGNATSQSTHSIFGSDTEDDDSNKGKHHVSIVALLAEMDPKVPKTVTATTRKRTAVAADLCDTDSSIASCDKDPTAKGSLWSNPGWRPRASVPYTPIVARKSKASNKKA
jgi:hypothetical protein